MSYGRPSRQDLQAQVRGTQGLEEVEEERQRKGKWWWENRHYNDVVALLNYGFLHGLPGGKTRGLILPNELDMAQATLRQMLDQGPVHGIGVCYEKLSLNPNSRLVDPDHEQVSYYLFCEKRGWYVVCPAADIFDEAA